MRELMTLTDFLTFLFSLAVIQRLTDVVKNPRVINSLKTSVECREGDVHGFITFKLFVLSSLRAFA